jgi:MFS family permease
MMENNSNDVTRDVTMVHFLLMFGYKLFSAYFPLYLAAQGLSLPQIGYSYLLIYLPIALFAPFAGFLSRKTNPALLMMIGIAGYAAYALAMAVDGNIGIFFVAQIMLGVAASLFFTSSRILMMAYPSANVERGFSWFYNAPLWADIVAPLIGGFLIWKVGFPPVFAISVAITLAALATAGAKLWRAAAELDHRSISIGKWLVKWGSLVKEAARPRALPYLAVSFSVLWLGGLYAAFFVLFLKNFLAWSQNAVIFYAAASSAFFSVVYILFIRPRQSDAGEKSVMAGATVAGLFSIFFGFPAACFNYVSVFAADFFKGAGSFVCNAGRSSFVARKLKKDPEEAGALDTMFAPLGVALGSLVAGLLIDPLGFQWLFFSGGAAVLSVTFVSWIFIAKK